MVTCSPFINIHHTDVDVDVDVRELELVKAAHASVQRCMSRIFDLK